jgi:hypothetical protein
MKNENLFLSPLTEEQGTRNKEEKFSASPHLS